MPHFDKSFAPTYVRVCSAHARLYISHFPVVVGHLHSGTNVWRVHTNHLSAFRFHSCFLRTNQSLSSNGQQQRKSFCSSSEFLCHFENLYILIRIKAVLRKTILSYEGGSQSRLHTRKVRNVLETVVINS